MNDFLPDDFFTNSDFESPSDVLAKFGKEIETKSGGLVGFQIKSAGLRNYFELRFFLVARYAEEFAIDIFTIRHPGGFFPCGLLWMQTDPELELELDLGNGNSIICHESASSAGELREVIANELSTDYFKKILHGLYSMSKNSMGSA